MLPIPKRAERALVATIVAQKPQANFEYEKHTEQNLKHVQEIAKPSTTTQARKVSEHSTQSKCMNPPHNLLVGENTPALTVCYKH
jgi:hypothetical protein